MIALRIRRRPKHQVMAVDVDNGTIKFAVAPESSDPLAEALRNGEFPDDAVSALWRQLVGPACTVVDVGAHLGMYSLPAAASGARVLAIEASPLNAAMLSLAAKRNAFDNLDIIQAAAAAQAGTTAFTALGPWGHVALEGELPTADLEVPTIALDDVLTERGWSRVDLLKIDVEGSEPEALSGMSQTLGDDAAPPILIESNGHMLSEYGYAPHDIIAMLERYDYQCHQIEQGPDRRLVPVDATDVQPECVVDYFAFKAPPDGLLPWRIVSPYDRSEIVKRLLATCRDDTLMHRRYGARVLEEARAPQSVSAWLLDEPGIKEVIEEYARSSELPISSQR
jgi:FkbM family methyltransferase